MSFDLGDFPLGPLMPHETWYRLFTDLIFDSLVRDVVREHYHKDPSRVTLHVNQTDSLLFIQSSGGVSFLTEDPDLREWALDFIAVHVFELDPDDVDTIFLDGIVGGQSAYLHISGTGILITSGQPNRGGRIL